MAKVYGEELRKQILETKKRMQDAIDRRAERIANWETDEDDCFISQRCEESAICECNMQLEMLEKLFGKKEDAKSDRELGNIEKQYENYTVCYFAPDISQYQGTAWGAINAMADMVGHAAPNRQSASYDENNWGRIMNGHVMLDTFAGMLAGAKSKS